MMNMFQLQERIKDFSKDQLVREMQQPSGTVPPFLVLSELQRRTRMEKAFQAEQAQGQQPTVAQDAIAAAGVPQGGIADMARAMAPQTDMAGNTGAAPVQQMREGGVVRMQPGGLTGSPDLAELERRLEEARRKRREFFSDEEVAALAAKHRTRVGGGLADVNVDVGSFTPAQMAAPAMDGGVGPLSNVDPELPQPRTAPVLPPIRPTDAQPILLERAPPSFSELAGPATVLGPEQGPNFPSVEDAARMIELNKTPAMLQRDLDLRFAQEQRDLAARQAATAGETPEPNYYFQSDGTVVPIDRRPSTPEADAFRAELASRPARAAEADRMEALNDIIAPSKPPEASESEPPPPSGYALSRFLFPFRDPEEERRRLREKQESRVVDPTVPVDEFTGLPADMVPEGSTDVTPARPRRVTPEPAPIPMSAQPDLLEELSRTATPPAPAPRTSDSTGGGAGRGFDIDRMLEQDKWLALAQFGLGLMASQQPTLGGAIGEAGTAALGQLGKAREAAVERDLAERTLAARSALRPDRLSLSDRLDYITDQMENVRLAISMEVDAGRKLALANDLASLQEQAAAILGTAGPATARAAAGRFDVTGG